jgi:hypothetical protein
LDYVEFNKDNPFQLTEQSFNRIRRFIDDTYEPYRPRPQPGLQRTIMRFNKLTREHPMFNVAVQKLGGEFVTCRNVAEFIHPAQRPSNFNITYNMKRDRRFKRYMEIDGYLVFEVVG